MMTMKELRRLPIGTAVLWREGANSPRAGEVTERGVIRKRLPGEIGNRRCIRWQDGQETDGSDEWALRNVEPDPKP